MLAFGILDMDMNSNKRYSDVTIEQTIFTDSAANLASSTVLPFKPCRKEQWTGINYNSTLIHYKSIIIRCIYFEMLVSSLRSNRAMIVW